MTASKRQAVVMPAAFPVLRGGFYDNIILLSDPDIRNQQWHGFLFDDCRSITDYQWYEYGKFWSGSILCSGNISDLYKLVLFRRF